MTNKTPEGVEVVEPLVIGPAPSFEVYPVASFNAMGKVIERILNNLGPDGKKKVYKTVVVDGVHKISKWAESVVIEELNKKWPGTTAIGKENLAAWAARNNLTCMPFERLATWSEVNGCNVFFTTLMKGEYLNNVKTGYKIDIQDRIKEVACDTRIYLSRDGRGYTAKFEKIPPQIVWEGPEEITIQKNALYVELAKREML